MQKTIEPPSWARRSWKDEQLAGLTKAEIEDMEAESVRFAAETARRDDEFVAARDRALALVVDIWGATSRQAKYIRSQARPFVGSSSFYDVSTLRRKIADARDRLQREAKRTEGDRVERERTERAIAWLLERGYKFGEDFNLSTAARHADNVAYEQEAARRAALVQTEGLITFSGQNCDSCLGWDGEGRRCVCGNRRVGWVPGYNHSFEKPGVEAEAH